MTSSRRSEKTLSSHSSMMLQQQQQQQQLRSRSRSRSRTSAALHCLTVQEDDSQDDGQADGGDHRNRDFYRSSSDTWAYRASASAAAATAGLNHQPPPAQLAWSSPVKTATLRSALRSSSSSTTRSNNNASTSNSNGKKKKQNKTIIHKTKIPVAAPCTFLPSPHTHDNNQANNRKIFISIASRFFPAVIIYTHTHRVERER